MATTKGGRSVFNSALKRSQRDTAAVNKQSLEFRALYDLPLMQVVKNLPGIKKNFYNIGFIGPNPYFFLQNMKFEHTVEKFYFAEKSQKSVEKSYDIISNQVEKWENPPMEIIPIVIEEENHLYEDIFEQNHDLDLIINNMTLHWENNADDVFKSFISQLEPDGVFISTLFGGDTLQELRICMNLAEQEREGGVAPRLAPMLSLSEWGNVFSRSSFKLPSADVMRSQVELETMFDLLVLLQDTAEQSALTQSTIRANKDTLIAAAALYQTLFNTKTVGHHSTSILVDTMVDKNKSTPGFNNILASLDIINLIGWKEHESQQKPKERGTAQFSLKNVVDDLEEEDDPDTSIRYGVLTDHGDRVEESEPFERKPGTDK